MKTIAMALLVLSGSAFGMPAVGNYAAFNAKITQGNSTLNGAYSLELTEYNASNGQYKQKTITDILGSQSVQENWLQGSDLLTDQQTDQIVTYCAHLGNGATPMDVNVPAGRFQTCAAPIDNDQERGTVWIGRVPFGIVKSDLTVKSNGRRVEMFLKSFR